MNLRIVRLVLALGLAAAACAVGVVLVGPEWWVFAWPATFALAAIIGTLTDKDPI